MNSVLIGSMDPALANFGVARLNLDLTTLKFTIKDLTLIETESRKGKTVRQNSDDLRRCKEIVTKYHELLKPCIIAFAEIPTGAQSARAMYAFGASVGMIASCPVPLIQVQPTETKLATVGTKTASKEEMIEWASEAYPDAPWLRKAGRILGKNEHLADAVAIAHAGIQTDQFRQLLAMWRAGSIAA